MSVIHEPTTTTTKTTKRKWRRESKRKKKNLFIERKREDGRVCMESSRGVRERGVTARVSGVRKSMQFVPGSNVGSFNGGWIEERGGGRARGMRRSLQFSHRTCCSSANGCGHVREKPSVSSCGRGSGRGCAIESASCGGPATSRVRCGTCHDGLRCRGHRCRRRSRCCGAYPSTSQP